jgi:Protein of unknown function, DUF547
VLAVGCWVSGGETVYARARRYAWCVLVLLAGCTTLHPVGPRGAQLAPPATFTHEAFSRVLQRFVDDEGRVDYAGLKAEPSDLERYYQLVAAYSPDSNPELFPTESSKLAYWINAYNAVSMSIVVAHYPIDGIGDIGAPFPFSLFSQRSGFFFFQRATFGGKTTSLYYLEHYVIRKRFAEPRVHFALNCASRGCPHLPRHAFSGQHLDAELEREVRRFFAEERNLRIDHAERRVFLSSILNWYKGDFLDWYAKRFPDREATLLTYAATYCPERADELRRAAGYSIDFVPYDWRLNDQHAPA